MQINPRFTFDFITGQKLLQSAGRYYEVNSNFRERIQLQAMLSVTNCQ